MSATATRTSTVPALSRVAADTYRQLANRALGAAKAALAR
jgi:hypothetical protein